MTRAINLSMESMIQSIVENICKAKFDEIIKKMDRAVLNLDGKIQQIDIHVKKKDEEINLKMK